MADKNMQYWGKALSREDYRKAKAYAERSGTDDYVVAFCEKAREIKYSKPLYRKYR